MWNTTLRSHEQRSRSRVSLFSNVVHLLFPPFVRGVLGEGHILGVIKFGQTV